jgi:RNA-directed DNA polymerase
MMEQVNYGLRGWANYYAHTHASRAFDKLQAYANRRLRRRRQKSGLGRYREMPDRFLYEKLGLAYIRRGHVRYVTS